LELIPIVIIPGQDQHVLTSSFGQSCWQNQKVGPNGIQCRVKILFGQTEAFEPMDDIVSQEKHLKEGDISHPILGRNLAQRVVVEQFPDVLLDSCSLGVEPPDPPRMGLQIGDQNMIGIFVVFEEGQLLGLDRIAGDRTPNDNKSMGLLPVEGFVSKLSDFPVVVKFLESTFSGSRLDGSIFLGDHRIATACRIQKFDTLLPKNPESARIRIRDRAICGGALAKQIFRNGTAPVLEAASPGRSDPCQNS
jgi:hypothetical protein